MKGEYQFIEIPKEEYDQLEEALKEMSTPYRNAEEFMIGQVREAVEKHREWKKTTEQT